jgi:hypothetical protein
MYKTISVEVEVDLDDFDTDDLVAELESRNVTVGGGMSEEAAISALSELHYALKFGLNEKALELARGYVNDQLGTAL